MIRVVFVVAVFLTLAVPAAAHHGGGTFDGSKEMKLTGTFTGLDLINPHSWIYFEVTGPDGKVTKYRCEMRSATVLRRSGWSPEMFKKGERLTFEGSPDRNDPHLVLPEHHRVRGRQARRSIWAAHERRTACFACRGEARAAAPERRAEHHR